MAGDVPCPDTLAPSEPRAPTRRLQVSPGLPEPALPRWQGALTCQGSYLFHDERRHTLLYEKALHISAHFSADPSEPPCIRPTPGLGEVFSLKTNPRAQHQQPPPPVLAGAELWPRQRNKCRDSGSHSNLPAMAHHSQTLFRGCWAPLDPTPQPVLFTPSFLAGEGCSSVTLGTSSH